MSKSDLYVLGGGGHSKLVINTLVLTGMKIFGVIDPRLAIGTNVLGIKVVGGDELLKSLNPSNTRIANGIGATATNRINQKLFNFWSMQGFEFVTVIHPTAIISNDVEIAHGCQIMAGAILQVHSKIGSGTVINTGVVIDHDCKVGAHCFIAPKVTVCGGVKIGESVFIGAGAILLPGVSIGDHAIIKPGMVVHSDVPDGVLIST